MKLNKTYALIFLMMTSFQLKAQPSEGFREAMKECTASTGVARPERGQRPSEEDRAKIGACLAEKGVTLPQRGGRRGRNK